MSHQSQAYPTPGPIPSPHLPLSTALYTVSWYNMIGKQLSLYMLLKLLSKLLTMNIYHLHNQGGEGNKITCLCKVTRKFQEAVHTQVLAMMISSWQPRWSVLGPWFCSILSFSCGTQAHELFGTG